MFPLTREAKNPVKSLIKSKTEKFANSVVFKLYLSSYWDCVNYGVKRPRGPVVKKTGQRYPCTKSLQCKHKNNKNNI